MAQKASGRIVRKDLAPLEFSRLQFKKLILAQKLISKIHFWQSDRLLKNPNGFCTTGCKALFSASRGSLDALVDSRSLGEAGG